MFGLRMKEAMRVVGLRTMMQPIARDARVIATAMDAVFRKHEAKLFDSEGASGGSTWARLSPEYKARKDRLFSYATRYVQDQAKTRGRKLTKKGTSKALGAENKTLQLTGDMRRAFSTRNKEHVAEGSVTRRTRFLIRLGAQGPRYYAAHEKGGPRLKRRSPIQSTKSQNAELLAAAAEAMKPLILAKIKAVEKQREIYRRGSRGASNG